MEIWKDVVGYDGIYEVSNIGNVKSLSRRLLNSRGSFISKEKILKSPKGNDGYLIVCLRNSTKGKIRRVHQLVAEAFLGHKPDGTHKVCVDHINNIKTDNRLNNLQLISHRENSSKDKINKTSKYTGVCWDKSKSKWKSATYFNKKWIHVGYFYTEIEAHNAYQEKLQQLNKKINGK